MTRSEKRMDYTLKLSQANPVKKLPRLAATIWLGKNLISAGFNRYKTHPQQFRASKRNDVIDLHAEMDAIIRASKHLTERDWPRAELYVARSFKTSGKKALAKPCKHCQRAIQSFGIRRVYWTEE